MTKFITVHYPHGRSVTYTEAQLVALVQGRKVAARLLLLLILLLLGVAVDVAAQTPPSRLQRAVQVTVGVSIVAHAVDLTTTTQGLACCGDRFREGNPLYRWAEHRPVAMAVAKMGTAVAVNAAILQLSKSNPKLALALAIGETVLVSSVAAHNALKIPTARN